ncbi:MAG: alcohol dehydrogenase catalytic domain-containing protein [Caldilineaceae bacterium]
MPGPRPRRSSGPCDIGGNLCHRSRVDPGYKGGYRGILGHEFVGVVEAAPGQPAWVGRRVVGEINIGCGDCELCRSGGANIAGLAAPPCIINHDGAFADYLILPVANLHPVPDAVPDDAAVFTEPLSAAIRDSRPGPCDPVRGSTNWAGASGAAGGPGAGPHRLRSHRDRAVGRLARPGRALTGASTVAVGSAAYQRLTEHPAPVVVDVTSAHAGFFAALDLVRPTGTIVLKSTTAALLDGFDMSRLVVDGDLRAGQPLRSLRRRAAHAGVRRRADSPLIAARYPLEGAVAALEHARRPGVLKVLLTIQ